MKKGGIALLTLTWIFDWRDIHNLSSTVQHLQIGVIVIACMLNKLSLFFRCCFLTLKYVTTCLWEKHHQMLISNLFPEYFFLLVKKIYELVSTRMFLHCHNSCHHFLGVRSNRIVSVHRYDGSSIAFLGCSSMWRMYFDNLHLLHDDSTAVQTSVHHDTRLNA